MMRIASTTINNYDKIVLLSGDFHCLPIVGLSQKNGKQVICVATMEIVDRTLQTEADDFIELNSIKSEIEKKTNN